VGNGILVWLSWAVSGVLLAIGAAMALIGRADVTVENRKTG
jgi:hypothetical protein